MTQNTDEAFQRQTFGSIVLTLLGIIQAAVFTSLAQDILKRIQNDIRFPIIDLDTLLSASLSTAGDVVFWRLLTVAVVLIIVTFEYAYFVMFHYRAVRVPDIIQVFLLGFLEFAMLSQTDSAS